MYFGLPLNQSELSRQITDKIQRLQLFSSENLARHSKSTRLLSLDLLDFISDFQIDETYQDLGQAIAFPRADIEFTSGSQIQEIPNLF